MRTVSKRPPPEPDDDPYRYGWRFVRVKNPDGSFREEQVPLTERDVLFPRTGDFIAQTSGHNRDVVYLRSVFQSQVTGDPSAAVISGCRVDWNLPRVRPLGPDVTLFFGVKQHQDWATFNVAAEGAQPALVVEITSENTRKNDMGIKVTYYHRAKVPLYLIADVTRPNGKRHLTLIGYRYKPEGYDLIEPDARGRIYLDPVRLSVGVIRDRRAGYQRLACFDPKTRERIKDYAELVEEIDKIRKQTQAYEREAAAHIQARIEAEAQAQAEARARADIQARIDAEAQIRVLEAELEQFRHQGSRNST